MYSDARKLLRLSCPFLNCSNSAEIRLSLLNKSLIWCLIWWMVVFRARDLNCLTNRCSSSFAPSLVKFTSPENFTFFPFMNSIIFVPFIKHRLSSSVFQWTLPVQQDNLVFAPWCSACSHKTQNIKNMISWYQVLYRLNYYHYANCVTFKLVQISLVPRPSPSFAGLRLLCIL